MIFVNDLIIQKLFLRFRNNLTQDIFPDNSVKNIFLRNVPYIASVFQENVRANTGAQKGEILGHIYLTSYGEA